LGGGQTKDARQRNIRHHITANKGPKPLEWASPVQQQFFGYGPAPACASGGFGAGKTAAACLKGIYLSDLYPGNRGVIARKTWEDLKKTTLPTLLKFLPPSTYRHGGKFAPSEKVIQLNPRTLEDGTVVPGSEILLLHLDDPETEHVIKGLEINWFLIDQAEDVAEEIFDLLTRRLGRWDQAHVPQACIDGELSQGRSWAWWNTPDGKYAIGAKPVPPTYAMLTCNPDNLYHWIYRRFHEESPEFAEKRIPDPSDPENGQLVSYKDLGFKMFHFPSLENKFLTKQNRVALLSGDESFKRRYVRGEWGIPEGTIHVVPKEALIPGSPEVLQWVRQNCTLHRSMDHGDSAPTSVLWWGSDREGNLFAYREYYQPNRLVADHRAAITAMSRGERYAFNVADPSIFGQGVQKEGKRWNVIDEWTDCRALPRETALFWTKGERDELGTRDRISEYLRLTGGEKDKETGKDKPRPHPITRELGFWPRIFFVQKNDKYPQGCDHAIRETRAQTRVKIGTDNGRPSFSDERDDKVPDHAYDCVRYFVASRPPGGPLPAKRGETDRTLSVWQEKNKRFQKAGGYKLMAERLRRQSA
jgi:hypothetical protein